MRPCVFKTCSLMRLRFSLSNGVQSWLQTRLLQVLQSVCSVRLLIKGCDTIKCRCIWLLMSLDAAWLLMSSLGPLFTAGCTIHSFTPFYTLITCRNINFTQFFVGSLLWVIVNDLLITLPTCNFFCLDVFRGSFFCGRCLLEEVFCV